MLQPQTRFEQPWERHRLRVPREDRTLYCRPDWDAAVAAVAANQTLLDGSAVNVQGRTLSHLREWAARAVMERASEFTARVSGDDRAIVAAASSRRVQREFQDSRRLEAAATEKPRFVVSGHQPSLFHPGVWVKNFAIDALSRQAGGIGLNLIVDNDALSGTAIRVPTGTRETPRVESVPFDEPRPARPWEEIGIADLELFRSFSVRVAGLMADWGIEPLLNDIWPEAVDFAQRGAPLPVCLTAARHRLERRWGLRNLELPLSRLCECDPFLWFAGHLFAHAERFRDVHNVALRQFREINRVRSRTHPVPELSTRDGWTESPFWIWTADDPRRRRAFVRTRGRETELFDGRDVVARFPLTPQMDACCAVEALRELPSRGIRLRTRALTTTLFARLCLADVFVHGIGGAKYDEMTDRIIARFFGMPAPEFVTMSATVRLPLAEPFDVSAADLQRLQQRLRDVRFNPERHRSFSRDSEALRRGALLPEVPESRLNDLVEEKKSLIAEQHAAATQGLSRSERRRRSAENARRYRRLREIREAIAGATVEKQERLEGEIAERERQLAANEVLQSREFSFCLYPESVLRSFLTGLF